MTDDLLFCLDGTLALHELLNQGKDDSPEAEALRDSLDKPMRSLGPAEKARVQQFSADLASVYERRGLQ